MKLLLIMPNFFDYPELIIDELNNMGYEVDFFDDRPSTNAFVKAAIRVNRNIINIYIKRYFNYIMNTVKSKQYDVVFLISGQSLSLSEEMIACIKKNQQNAKFILYQWDSQANFPYIKKFHKYFDKCYSFDKNDVKKTPNMEFLPLFYSKIYEKIGEKNIEEYKYDFCFVGTAHPQKYKFINLMCEQLKPIYKKQFIYFYFPSPIVFLYRKIMNKEMKNAKYREFHYTPLTGNEMNYIYESSRCVLDSAQSGQVGLTMRAIEALGAKKKLITTNEDIVSYDFYKPENIYVYKDKINLDDLFFKQKYTEINSNIYEKYSLKSWLKELLK